MTNKYLRTIYGVDKEGNAGSLQVDVYDILDAYPTKNPALDHLIKKALCPGQRGHKDLLTDLDDIIKSAQRAKAMIVNKMASSTEARDKPEDSISSRPTSFRQLHTIFCFPEALGHTNMERLWHAVAGVCRFSRINNIVEAPIGAVVVGSFKAEDKLIEGRHAFSIKEALEILAEDKQEGDVNA